MVTKQEIETECQKEIEKLQKELSDLEEQHKKFTSEDEDEIKRQRDYNRLSNKLSVLENKSYLGNWGNYDNWYYSKIPSEFMFDESDSEEIKIALTQIKDESLKRIEETEEYKKVSEEKEKVTWSKFSKEHSKIHEKIEDLERSVKWNENRINSIQTKGGLIELTKHLAQQKRQEESNKNKQEKVKEYKERILNATK